ncbi:MAG TPA: hypothetical protein VF476_12230 [Chitinophagaceae bacterium]
MFAKADIEKYFVAEKQESLWFLIIGIVAVSVAIVFFFILKTQFYRGAAIPLFLVGIILGTVGYTVNKRSDNDRISNVYAYDMDPSHLKQKELPRMESVIKKFVVYRYVEIFLFLIGVALYIYFICDFNNDLWRGFGLALAIMAVIALIGDHFAEKRAKHYTKGLKTFTEKF